MTDCAFCDLMDTPDRPIKNYAAWVAFKPIAPVNDGHRLLVPKRHVAHFHELSDIEASRLPRILSDMRLRLGATHYNLGVNSGAIAGQTVFHLHIHLIPREVGDVADSRGGIIAPLAALIDGSQFADYIESVAAIKAAEGAAK